MTYREYTHCVEPADYVDNTPPSGFGNVIATVLTDPVAVAGWISTACSYLLGGKLVCLGGDRCAIGRITKFEKPGDKSFPSNIDNDFSMNILLAPHAIGDMTGPSYIANYNAILGDGMQGELLKEASGTPMPHEAGSSDDDSPPTPWPSPSYMGYSTKYPDSNYPEYNPSDSPFQVPGSDGHPFWVPCLHVEFEGSRINDVCAAIAALQGPVSGFCDVPIIGWIACAVIDIVLLPIMSIAIAVAWANATDGDYADAQIGSGQLELGDLVVATGRFVYDAAHQGWNELHAGYSIQRITNQEPPLDPAEFNTWSSQWCGAIANVPPYAPPGAKPTDMTPAQTTTYTNQLDPSNQWIFHPAVDGCTGGDQPPPPR